MGTCFSNMIYTLLKSKVFTVAAKLKASCLRWLHELHRMLWGVNHVISNPFGSLGLLETERTVHVLTEFKENASFRLGKFT